MSRGEKREATGARGCLFLIFERLEVASKPAVRSALLSPGFWRLLLWGAVQAGAEWEPAFRPPFSSLPDFPEKPVWAESSGLCLEVEMETDRGKQGKKDVREAVGW